jgi:integrase
VTHDLRRTLATGMVERGISMETVAAVLGHAVGGASLATLRRHYVHTENLEPKRRALEAWSQRVAALVEGASAASSVIPFVERSALLQAR